MTKKRQQTLLAGATISEFDGVRYLHLGTDWVQGAMRLPEVQDGFRAGSGGHQPIGGDGLPDLVSPAG